MPLGKLTINGDNIYTQKVKRIQKLTQEVEAKIDGIPGVVNDATSTSTTDALSANMGKVLQDQINELKSMGRFLSTWDCTTGLPTTDPVDDPYDYRIGDYYIVSIVSDTTNYRPYGNIYIHGQASTTVETSTVKINDWYLYDGQTWILQKQNQITINVDNTLSTSSTNAVENRVITNAINSKQNTISDLATIRSNAALGATAIQPGDNISELTNNIGYQTAGDVVSAIAGKANTSDVTALTTRVATAEGKISTLENTSSDYASRISDLETSSGGTASDISDLQDDVSDLQTDLNTKTFHGVWGSTTTAQQVYDWISAGHYAIINVNDGNRKGNVIFSPTNVTNGSVSSWPYYHSSKASGGLFYEESNILGMTVADGVVTQAYSGGNTISNDSHLVVKSPQEPSSHIDGSIWNDTTNNVLKLYNGGARYPMATERDISDLQDNINTKTFYLSSTSDLTTAQAVYDWYVAGKNPIVAMGDLRYNVISSTSSRVIFVNNNAGIVNGSDTSLRHNYVTFTINNGTVQGVTSEAANDYVLSTDINYPTPYVPLYDGSPATKKYVDDIVGDIETLLANI